MNSWLLTYLSLSVSGSLLFLLLRALQPLLRGRTSRRWQYYIWLVVVLRLLLPLGPESSLMAQLSSAVPPITESVPSSEETEPAQDFGEASSSAGVDETAGREDPPAVSAAQAWPDEPTGGNLPFLQELGSSLWLLWLAGAFTLLVRKCSGYNAFLGYIKAGRRPVKDGPVLDAYTKVCGELGVGRPPALYHNPIAAAPMLVGVFRPFIVLPSLDGKLAEPVLRHELVHYRRGDIFYKWLAQLAACLHWFNPLVYLLLRQINRDCELSCDEAVIRSMDEEEKFFYGESLLAAIRPDPGYSNAIVSITLNEDIHKLKERLDAIMNYRAKSRLTTLCSTALAAVLAVAGLWTGVYAAPAKATLSADAEQAGRYLVASPYWREHVDSGGGDTTNKWPDYMASTHTKTNADSLINHFFNTQDTQALLTVWHEKGRLDVSVLDKQGNAVFHMKNLSSGQHWFTIPASQEAYAFQISAKDFAGGLLLESVTGSAPGQTAPTSPDAAAQDCAGYLNSFPWKSEGMAGGWPDYLGLNGDKGIEAPHAWQDLEISTPTSLVLTAHTAKGIVTVTIEGPSGETVFQRGLGYGSGDGSFRYRILLDDPGAYRVHYSCDGYYGRLLLENEANTDAFRGMSLVTFGGRDESAPAATTGKSRSADQGAYEVMYYAGTWDMVEQMLPYMTHEGIDRVVALYNQKNRSSEKTASSYYNLAIPSRAESDRRALELMEQSANWAYASPLFPYMTNSGIDAVVAVYNQRTGNRLSPADYHN